MPGEGERALDVGGGEAGRREPRRPKPPLRHASAEVDVEAVAGE